MRARVWVLLLALAAAAVSCMPAESEKRVLLSYEGLNDDSVGGRKAFFLYAEDKTSCEVDSARYVRTRVGSLARCAWGQP